MRADRRWMLHALFAVVGLGGVVAIAYHSGFERLWGALASLSVWLPIVFALEGGRIAADVWATWLLYGDRTSELEPRTLVRATLMTYVAVLLLPAGRFGGEAIKAAIMRHEVGLERAAASAVFMQSFPLLAGAVVSAPCVALAFAVWGSSWLTWAIAAQAATAGLMGAAILVAAQRPGLGKIVERLSKRVGAATSRVQGEVRAMGWLPPRPFLVGLLGRALLGLQLVVLAAAIDVPRGFVGGVLTFGVHLVGAAVGDLVPAQLGTTDGALAFAADELGAPAASLVAAALVFHVSQLAWALVGAIAALRRT